MTLHLKVIRVLCCMLPALVAAAGLSSCKTNEKNMMDAYDKAMAGRAQQDQDDDIIYNKIRREMKHEALIVGKDTMDVSTQWVRLTEDGGGVRENIKRYCVVVGQFKQRFNAKSMRERLVENGYPGTFVVETREPYYFVVAASYNDLQPAMEMLRKVEGDKVFHFKSPLPFLLRPSQIK